ncbi:MAG: LacI family DNA-binding transcriptional regulator [Chitinophagaceae bacterium]
MIKKNINIKELASALGLSTSTISRAFRDNSDINPDTKEHILAKAKELGYQPNIFASSLREKAARTIAIVLPELANNFFSQAVKGIEQITRAHNYHTLVYVTDSIYEKEVSILTELQSGRVDGIIMSATGEGKDSAHIVNLVNMSIPVVFFDRIYEDIDLPKIITNDYQSSFQATKDLIERGCRKIAFLVIDPDRSIGQIRTKGYKDAIKAAGFKKDEIHVLECDNDREISYDIIRNFILETQPDAIVTAVERLAVVTYRVCINEHISIPEQLKVIGFSSLEIADLLNPSLSTITQPAFEMGRKAAQQLFVSLKSPKHSPTPEPVVLSSSIIHRKSTQGRG